MELNNDEIRRYSRHLILPEVGLAGQKKIKGASVLCIGAGGLGSPIAMYLAAAGIGKIGIVDFDTVDYSNLQRQILHTDADVGRPKAQSAKETLHGINPNCEVVIHNTRITSKTHSTSSGLTTSSWTARTISQRAISPTTPACCSKSRMSMVRFSGSRARPACLRRISADRVTVVFIPNRRRPAWCRVARKAACSACCPASSAASRPRKF